MINKLFWIIRALFLKLLFGKIGWLSYIGRPIYLKGIKNIYIGNRVRIFPGVRMETHGPAAKIIIEDNVGIGQNFHITAMDELKIGKGTTISGNVFITDIDHFYQEIGISILNQPMIKNKTVIGDYSFIGYGAAIQAGTKLGKQCIVGTNAVIRGDYPDYSVIVGVPGRIIKRYNTKTGLWEKTNNKGDFLS